MPLAHPPGQAQFDFGESQVIYRGRKTKAMFCVMSLPDSDVFFVQAFPRECTESFQEGRESPAKLIRLDNRPHLQDHQIPEPNLVKYRHLLQQHELSYRIEKQEQHQ